MNSSQTSVSDSWILGVKGGDSLDWGSEVNSSSLSIISWNTAPAQPSILSPSDGGYYTSVDINFTATDGNNDNLTFWVYINSTTPNQTTTNFSSFTDDDGNYSLIVMADDGTENSTNSSTIYFVLDNSYPTISYDSLTSANYTNASRSYIEINATYSETYFANVTWNINGTEYVNTSRFYYYNATGLGDGNYYYNVSVCDLANNCNTTDTRLIVLDTTTASLSYDSLTAANNSYKSQTYIEINVTYTEASFANITWNINGTERVNATETHWYNETGLSNGNYSYNVTLCDTSNNCNSTETRLIILDSTAPSWSNNQTNATSSTPKYGDVLQINLTITEVGLSNLSYYVLAHNMSGAMTNGSFNPVSGTSFTIVENLTLSAGRGTLKWQVWFNDSTGNSANSTEFLITIYNTGPVTVSPRISPASPDTADTLQGFCNATDSDNDDITYHWQWYKNSVLNISGTQSSYTQSQEANIKNLSSSNTTANDNWTFSCLADDLSLNGSWSNVSVVITNAQPTISQFNMTDDDPATAGYQIDPITNAEKTFYVWFNVTDSDGVDDINGSWIKIWDSVTSEANPKYTNYSLTQVSCSATVCLYNGSLSIWYYDEDGTWNISVYANDSLSNASYNDNFDITQLTGFTLTNSPIEFGTLQPNISNQNASSPLTINNKGNQNLSLNISASGNLTGATDATKAISIENIDYANTSGFSAPLDLNISSNIFTSSLIINSTHDLYFRISVPTIKAQHYSSNITIETS